MDGSEVEITDEIDKMLKELESPTEKESTNAVATSEDVKIDSGSPTNTEDQDIVSNVSNDNLNEPKLTNNDSCNQDPVESELIHDKINPETSVVTASCEINNQQDPAASCDEVLDTVETEKVDSIKLDELQTAEESTTDIGEQLTIEESSKEEVKDSVENSTMDVEESSKEEAQSEKPERVEVAKELPIEETSCSTSNDKQTPKKSLTSDTQEDILNLLKSLSPEKLEQIKSKVLEITTEGKDGKNKQSMAPTESTSKKSTVKIEKVESKKKEQDVICLDSDEEQAAISPKPDVKREKEPSVKKRKVSEISSEGEKKKLKECINPNCPRNVDDEYIECPVFIMKVYYISRKPNKNQWICSTCFDSGINIYEQLCYNVNSNIPWTSVKIPKEQVLVEVVDSDDEDETGSNDKKRKIPESEMFVFDAETEDMVEDVLKDIASRVDIKMQLDNEFKIIERNAMRNGKALVEMNEQLKVIEKKSQVMYDELYAINRPKLERRPSLHINQRLYSTPENNLRTVLQNKTVVRAAPAISRINSTTPSILETNAFAIRHRAVNGGGVPHWTPCKLLEEINTPEGKKFKVQFNDNLPNTIALVKGREYAMDKVSENLEIGTRIIARFPRSNAKGRQIQVVGMQMRFLPGVVGEKLTNYNHRRYLIFCDYGQVKYCAPGDVREVFETSMNVWDDVHKNLSQFIRDYLVSRREVNKSRAMLNLSIGSKILVEQTSDWRQAIVHEVDCSLAKIFFPHDKSSEWLYRGSKRLHPIYMQAAKSQNSGQRSAFRRDPGISYIAIDDEDSSEAVKKNIAKKSTAPVSQQPETPQQAAAQVQALPQDKVTILNDDHIYLEEPANVGKVRHFTPKQAIKPQNYIKHDCCETCLPAQQNNLSSFSPLAKPLLACWERQIVRQKTSRWVVYKAPCGRRLRNMREIFNYLRLTKSFLNVENFDLDPTTQVLATYTVQQTMCGYYKDDCTDKKEGMKIPIVNAFDDVHPPPLEYSSKRIPMPGVNINTDPEFMSCCDCTDDCVDKSKCACFQLTIQGAKYKKLMEGDDDDISYVWKRLMKNVPTGIYECNSRCKCSERCLNKVVQKPIAVKMMLFRTKKRGWGLKTVHDIPKGTFICVYAGNLYPEKDANALCQGQDHGDEYFAELDLIEVVEGMKEGYEAGVIYPDSDEEKVDTDSDYDEHKDKNDDEDGDFVARSRNNASGGREILTRSSKTNIHGGTSRKNSSETPSLQRTNSEDSSDNEIPTVNMIPAANTRIPLRKLFGFKERPYIMDAKKCGNIGRYFNHSCDPNLFVQNVFVDTHDLRFPWIAFFTSRQVKASEELTWNYQYEIGSVPSKVLYCHCGTKNCIGRIL